MTYSFTNPSEKIMWGIIGLLIAAFVTFVLYSFFGALIVGLFLYYATRPINQWLNSRTDHPSINATITILVVGLPILLVLGYAGFVALRELNLLLGSMSLGQLRNSFSPYIDFIAAADTQGIVGVLRNNLSLVRRVATTAFTWFLRLFVIVTVCYYLLRDDQKIARWFRRSFDDYPAAVDFMEHVDDDLTTIYTGNLITIGVTGLIAAGVFYGLNFIAPTGAEIRFPILFGLLIGIATLIPGVGMKIVYFPYTAYLVWQSVRNGGIPIWFPVVFFVVTVIVVDSFPDFFIRSYLSKGDLNMGLMLLTYVLGAVAFGWYGVFFGPVILVFFTNFAREIFPTLIDKRATVGK